GDDAEHDQAHHDGDRLHEECTPERRLGVPFQGEEWGAEESAEAQRAKRNEPRFGGRGPCAWRAWREWAAVLLTVAGELAWGHLALLRRGRGVRGLRRMLLAVWLRRVLLVVGLRRRWLVGGRRG